MLKHSRISLAIAATVLAMGAQAAGSGTPAGISGERVTGASPQAVQPAAGQRFVVKLAPAAANARGTLDASLRTATRRAGLDRAIPATVTAAARAPASASVVRAMAAPGWHVVRTSRPLSGSEAASFIRELSAEPGIASVEADRLYQRLAGPAIRAEVPAMTPDDPGYGQYQWNFTDATGGVRAPEAWDISTGEGVVVAVLDTGIVEDALDLAGNVVPGYDMITDARISRRDSDERVPGGWDLGDWVEANYCTGWAVGGDHGAVPSSWHGSHVAGTIAQETDNAQGVAGLAHGANVLPVRVLGSCGGFGSDIADGILWAAGAEVEGLPVNGNPAEIINMSLGSSGPSACPAIYQDAIDQANALGSIIVVAAGNANDDAGAYTMSSCDGVISVGATGITGAKAAYSSYGARVDIAAPGGGGAVDGNPNGYIWQVVNGGETSPDPETWYFGGMTGTSMASPHVAAAAALVQSVVETPLDWSQMRDLLKQTARPFPVSIPAATPIGAGILNAKALLDKATEEPCDPETQDCGPDVVELVNKVELRNQSSEVGDGVYSFEAEAGKVLSFMTMGGVGDVSAYASFDAIPDEAAYEAKSTRAGNLETIRFTAPKTGTYYLRLTGTYTGLTVVVRQ
ncbi:S8 family serine peptidase [Luteimonas sp. BDR2-5]|uniref:S8 family peptidase n=1 Tax=Proluteimonas luteida TaxID=2878685 RepID=UPI001E2D4983|nr:S8 family peptidase [Luteimonas sp. BDR2-5]MCD9027971.1 S8 family serine peptidase [Luteimonas sp. BDR2-5]